jgi:cellulose biosynthesis protein BcsQ
MNPLDLHNFIRLLLAWDAEHITALCTGLIFGAIVTWAVAKNFIRRRVQMEDDEALALRLRAKRLTEEGVDKDAAYQELRKDSDEKINALHKQMAELLKSAHAQAVEFQQAQHDLNEVRDEARAQAQRAEAERNEKQYLLDENRRLSQDREQIQDAYNQNAALTQQNTELAATVRALQQRTDAETAKARELGEQCERLRDSLDERERHDVGKEDLELEVNHLREKIQLVTDLDGKFWERSPQFGTPPFRPVRGKVAKIIAVANLKGGVGKTTLTANLGAALANRGYRVLLVDLDYQQSLTTLCLPPEKASQVLELGRVVRHVFKTPHAPDQVAWQNLTEITNPLQMHLLATDEWLVDEEERAKFAWLLDESSRDVRYLFRSAFHAPRFQERFDVILFDCPPRLTTACINALAASDFVLIPVLLDKISADAVPRLLGWMEQLRIRHVCLNLGQAGIVGNEGRTHGGEWIRAHQDILHRLREHCRGRKLAVDLFEQVVPFKSEFAEAAERHTFASLGNTLAPVFSQLVDELITRKVIHESPRLAAVH